MINDVAVEAAEGALSVLYPTWRDCAIGVVEAVEPVFRVDLRSKIEALHASEVDEYSSGWESALNEILFMLERG